MKRSPNYCQVFKWFNFLSVAHFDYNNLIVAISIEEYVYHTLAAKASGELCLKYIFAFGAFTRVPLLESASEWKVPTTFIYGYEDWMSYEGAQDARKHMKVPCEIIRVPQAGHFVFIDNPTAFHSAVLYGCHKFLSPDQVNDSLPEGLTAA